MFDPKRMEIVNALIPLLQHTADWDRRYKVEYYVALCVDAGFANTNDAKRLCAERYLAGKRKVTPPGTDRKKKQEKKMREMLANTPPELIVAIDQVMIEMVKAVAEYRSGNAKALNSMVGGVMKKYRGDAAIVRELLVRKLSEKVENKCLLFQNLVI